MKIGEALIREYGNNLDGETTILAVCEYVEDRIAEGAWGKLQDDLWLLDYNRASGFLSAVLDYYLEVNIDRLPKTEEMAKCLKHLKDSAQRAYWKSGFYYDVRHVYAETMNRMKESG